jgi:phosphatidylserine/phosphatidylglycerophosphate/cardiolipin synthase-like enzyme
MFQKGNAVGRIQPYFLTQIETPLQKGDPINSRDNSAAIQQQALQAANVLADFMSQAKHRLDIAIYDFRLLKGKVHDTIVGAINDAAKRGIAVRIAYDKDAEDKTPGTIGDFFANGADPAPDGTNKFMEKSGRFDERVTRKAIVSDERVTRKAIVSTEGIDPQHHIMHQKYILRDALTPQAGLLMGSANFTLDAWAAQENNILTISGVPDLVRMYANDFGEMWTKGAIGSTGVDDFGTFDVGGDSTQVCFAPGGGTQVESLIAGTIASATNRLYVASMVISSGKILSAIQHSMMDVQEFGGICDGGSMAGVEAAWAKAKGGAKAPKGSKEKLDSFSSAEKAALWQKLKPHFHEKHSIKYADNMPHNFMHDKVAVADDVVVTGSFNFSNNAMKNAENILVIRSKELADQYVEYIKGLLKRYK